MLNLVRGLTWSCNMDRIETINNAIMYNQSYCLKRVEYISNSSSILPPQLQCSEQLVKQEVTSIFRIMIILNQTSAQAQMGSPDKPGGIKWTK
jgi:hypothetical protein